MERIDATLKVYFVSKSISRQLIFDDTWNFTIGRFEFENSDKHFVNVKFSFSAELIKIEDGRKVFQIPSLFLDELRPILDELECILDLLSLEIGEGLRVDYDGAYLRSSGGTSLINEVSVSLSAHDPVGLEKRLYNLKNETDDSRSIGKILRLHRRTLNAIDAEWSVTGYWAIVENLIGRPGGNMLTPEQLEVMKQCLESMDGLRDEDRDTVYKRVESTLPESPLDFIARSLKLMNSSGEISDEEIRGVLKSWKSYRNPAAHGGSFGRYDEKLEDALSDMEDTVQSLLLGKVTPKMIAYVVFNETDIDKQFVQSKGYIISRNTNGGCVFPIPQFEVSLYVDGLTRHIRENNGRYYIVTYDSITEVTLKENKNVSIDEVSSKLQELVKKSMAKINEK